MIDLSIVIVNYNVRQFVLQCLESVFKSELQGLNIEVILVDNNSTDGSVSAVTKFYPQVHVIANTDNPGFSKANNQGIKISSGEFVLLLNPDTVIAEDTIVKCLNKMRSQSDIGALGVKMIDGTGAFLPESKRSFPTVWNSMTKLLGLSTMFPSVKLLGGYNLTYLPADSSHDIDVLCGAFMLMRKEALQKSGLLDEDFFMYGEDIDLSYRIKKAGYRILYFADTTIIHYKGESTKKSSVNYVKTFYKAMIIYVKKHYSGGAASFFVLLLSVSIYLRAGISLLRRFWDLVKKPVLDGILIVSGLHLVKHLWSRLYFEDVNYFKNSPLDDNIWIYTVIWIACLSMYGHYTNAASSRSIIKGVGIGTLVILVMYALLPMDYRSSRAIILLGGLLALVSIYISTLLWNKTIHGKWNISRNPELKVFIVGSTQASNYIKPILLQSSHKAKLLGLISPKPNINSIGDISRLSLLAKQYKADELIFSAEDLSYHQIINQIKKLGPIYQYKIANNTTMEAVGSNSKDHSGEYYSLEANYRLSHNFSTRQKRTFDIWSSLILLILSPIVLIINGLRWKSVSNTYKVLIGQLTWVSYIPIKDSASLPKIKSSVLSLDSNTKLALTEDQQNTINENYARFYEVWSDQILLLRNLHRIHIIY